MCEKIPHANKSDAKRQAIYVDDSMHVYFCLECRAWHYGHAQKFTVEHNRAKRRYKDWKHATLHDEYE